MSVHVERTREAPAWTALINLLRSAPASLPPRPAKGRARHKARGLPLGLPFILGLCSFSLTAGAAELTGLSVSPINPTVAVGAIQPFRATGTFDDGSTRPLTNATLAAGDDRTCTILESGGVRCWGLGSYGQLGNGTFTTNSPTPVTVSGITNAIAITNANASGVLGTGHSCTVLASGTVQCWGANVYGQLGDGTTTNSSTPVTVSGITTATAIAAGATASAGHTCAVLANGSVQCWGDNGWGQLGNGTTVNSSIPVTVSGITTATAITAGPGHTCALLAGGGMRCWGYGAWGQLGNAGTTNSSNPVTVSGISTATAIAAGGNHSCAILADGGVKCWGENGNGELGNGELGNGGNTGLGVTTPVTVVDLNTATGITAGRSHTCAVLANGSMQCWGNNGWGQLGNGTTVNSSIPVAVSGISNATTVDADYGHTCARLTDNSVRCWGYNGYGQLGNGDLGNSSIPVNVIGITTATAIGAGDAHTCARLANGSVQCWGVNSYGQLGDGTAYADWTRMPVTVSGITTATAVGGGQLHTCAVLADGRVQCWGSNGNGQLGNGSTTDSSIPVTVSGITTATGIAVGWRHTCAVLASGDVRCWGLNDNGRYNLGGGSADYQSSIPVPVSDVTSAIAIAAGGQNGPTCALLADGSVRCWGYNSYGQLGNGGTTGSAIPVTVSGISNAVAIGAGGNHACAVIADGRAQCWGINVNGQLGDGTTTSSSIPVTVSGITTAIAIDGAYYHTCAVLESGSVQCWGYNGDGKLGNGSTANSLVPVTVSEISNAIAIATGSYAAGEGHSCAVLASGMVQCWGASGLLGNTGPTCCSANSSTPIRVTNVYTAFGLDWTSSSPLVARVDAGGYALALGVGTSTIAATYGAVTGSTLLTVVPAPDTDGDGVSDASDNCTLVANADQRDTDNDGYGNRCDADFNQSNFVNITDLGIFKARFGTTNADADLDGNGFVNITDLGIFKSLFGRAPGPSGLAP